VFWWILRQKVGTFEKWGLWPPETPRYAATGYTGCIPVASVPVDLFYLSMCSFFPVFIDFVSAAL